MNFVCSECGHTAYRNKGYNSTGTKKRIVCKNCGKNFYVDLAVFESETETFSPEINESVPRIQTVDLKNERMEDVEPDVPKTRYICINGQTGVFPNFTDAMVRQYAQAQNHTLTFKDGVYYLTAKPGSKG